MPNLAGKVGLITGVANRHSIAAGCAVAAAEAGARLILTCQNDTARSFAEPAAEAAKAEALLTLNIQNDEELDAVFAEIEQRFGRLDFVLHSMAFCRREDLHAEVVDTSREGFAEAMDISCHSLIRMTKRALPMMKDGGSVLTMSYYGAEKVVDHYNIMGPIKAALESTVRYLAADLGERGVRVNALSPGPIKTRAASGIEHFDELMADAVERSPGQRLVTIEEVGAFAAFLMSDGAKGVTGGVHYVDAGMNIVA